MLRHPLQLAPLAAKLSSLLESVQQSTVSVCAAIFTNPNQRWYEPQHVLLGSKTYFAHTWGSIYVLSGAIATFLASVPPEALRYFSNEGKPHRVHHSTADHGQRSTHDRHCLISIQRICVHLQRQA